MCDNDEHNYVADANNWEKRVKGEMEIARKWDEVWGDKYATGQPKDYKGKIKKLEEEMKTLQVARLMTNSQMSYTRVNPYKEYGPNHRRKTFGKQDDEEILKQAEILGIDVEKLV